MKRSFGTSRILIAFVALFVGLQLGCQNHPPPSPENPDAPSPDNTYLSEIRPGDRVVINFADNSGIEPIWEQTVTEEGIIMLPFNQKLNAKGMSESQLEQAIHDLYVPKLFTRLSVNARLAQRSFFVDGEVRAPGQQELTGTMTVMKAVAAAGGFTDYAKKSKIEVIRRNGQKIEVNGKDAMRDPAKCDLPVYAGDRVFVYRRVLFD